MSASYTKTTTTTKQSQMKQVLNDITAEGYQHQNQCPIPQVRIIESPNIDETTQGPQMADFGLFNVNTASIIPCA